MPSVSVTDPPSKNTSGFWSSVISAMRTESRSISAVHCFAVCPVKRRVPLQVNGPEWLTGQTARNHIGKIRHTCGRLWTNTPWLESCSRRRLAPADAAEICRRYARRFPALRCLPVQKDLVKLMKERGSEEDPSGERRVRRRRFNSFRNNASTQSQLQTTCFFVKSGTILNANQTVSVTIAHSKKALK